MKKILEIVLIVMLVVLVCGCNNLIDDDIVFVPDDDISVIYTDFNGEINKLRRVINELPHNYYYQFEEQGEEFILFNIYASSYSGKPKILSMDVKNKEYTLENILKLTLNIQVEGDDGDDIPMNHVPFYDIKTCIMKVKNEFKGLTLCNEYGENEFFKYNGNVVLNEKYGYEDLSGEIIIPCEYDEIYQEYPEYLILKKNNKKGLADIYGNIILNCNYDYILPKDSKSFYVVINENNSIKTGIVNNQGDLIKGYIDGTFERMSHYLDVEELLQYEVLVNDQYKGIIDKELNVIVEANYDDVIQILGKEYDISQNYSVYKGDEKYLYEFDQDTLYIPTHFIFEKDNVSNVVNLSGDIIITQNTDAQNIKYWAEQEILDKEREKIAKITLINK